MKQRKLLIADDSEMNRAILANMLEQDFEIIETTDGEETIAALENYHGVISALLLDIVMPGKSGFDVLEEVKRRRWIDDIPTIMISAETNNKYIDRAFELGASDYISRPFAPGIIRHRIINTILLHTKKQQLVDAVASRFYRREKSNEVMVSILDYAVELRSGEQGMHMFGVNRLTELILKRLAEKTNKYNISESDIEVISMASGLHDIGKLLIPEEILKKPGRLTEEEFETVKHHTQIGAGIITELPIYQNEELAKYAATICHWHHERWNGEGYPDGLKGDEIPLAAQVVSIADAYDALTNARSYKKAYSHEKAVEMICNGECGTFNPLILECMVEVAGTTRPSEAAMEVWQKNDPIHRAVEAFYQGQDTVAARMTLQLEDANTKQEFMSNLSDEIWFEYTAQPSSVHLSKGASDHTGLPSVIINPQEDKAFRKIIGKDVIEQLKKQIEEMSAEEVHTELMAKIELDGKKCLCRIAILVLWSEAEHGRCSTLLGKVIDIDEEYGRLEDFDKMMSEEVTEQILLPVAAAKDDVLRITGRQVAPVIKGYKKMFEAVRLVDPGICMQVSADINGHSVEKNEHCYSILGKTKRCEKCISQEAIRTRKAHNKVELIGENVYYILAMCIEIDGIPYSLECINPIYTVGSAMEESENILNQLIVRNRQVYKDSVTQVYNRHYYDTRIRNITGENAVAMADIDNFKQINDRFGHAAGDKALYCTAQAIRLILRSNDELIRYGGDEFVILFNGLQEQIMKNKLEDICRAVRSINIPEYPELNLSVSIGGVHGSGRVSELIEKADRALYRAKINKDCAEVFEEEKE